MKEAYFIIDLFLGATDFVNYEDFYSIGFRASATQFQGRYSPSMILNISRVATCLQQDGHEISDWYQEIDKETGFVTVDFRLNGRPLEFTLT